MAAFALTVIQQCLKNYFAKCYTITQNENACNFGWNSVHDSSLLTVPAKTYEEALNRIMWFTKLFKAPTKEIIHNLEDPDIK